KINSTIQQKLLTYNSLTIPPIENIAELEQLIPNFRESYNRFSHSVILFKNSIIAFLQNGGELNIILQNITTDISSIIPRIGAEIDQNNLLLRNRNALVSELNELNAKEFLFNNKTVILQYY